MKFRDRLIELKGVEIFLSIADGYIVIQRALTQTHLPYQIDEITAVEEDYFVVKTTYHNPKIKIFSIYNAHAIHFVRSIYC